MTLDELITALEAADPTLVLPHGFTNPHSYRGYYDELAFEPATDVTVADMLTDARSALNATFTGWKGGDYTMRGYTDCWLAQEGSGGGETLGSLLLNFMITAGAPATARQATGQTDTALPDPTTADDPTPLRWGLDDVMWGDDDTVIVCLSGPDRAPYWLELEPERAAALRDALTPDDPAVGQPAEAQGADEARPSRTQWRVEGHDATRTGQLILNCLTGRAVCGVPRPADEATGLLDAYRAAVLREAADEAERLRQFEKTTGARAAAQISENVGILRVATRLRRMADEETSR